MGCDNLPHSQLKRATTQDPETVKDIILSLQDLNAKGKPETDTELNERIEQYFNFCGQSSIKPGVESLCLALHISRTTFFRWSHGEDCSKKRMEIIQQAHACINAFMEQALLNGKINPVSAIFLMKNVAGYKDAISFEQSTPRTGTEGQLLETLPDLSIYFPTDKTTLSCKESQEF